MIAKALLETLYSTDHNEFIKMIISNSQVLKTYDNSLLTHFISQKNVNYMFENPLFSTILKKRDFQTFMAEIPHSFIQFKEQHSQFWTSLKNQELYKMPDYFDEKFNMIECKNINKFRLDRLGKPIHQVEIITFDENTAENFKKYCLDNKIKVYRIVNLNNYQLNNINEYIQYSEQYDLRQRRIILDQMLIKFTKQHNTLMLTAEYTFTKHAKAKLFLQFAKYFKLKVDIKTTMTFETPYKYEFIFTRKILQNYYNTEKNLVKQYEEEINKIMELYQGYDLNSAIYIIRFVWGDNNQRWYIKISQLILKSIYTLIK